MKIEDIKVEHWHCDNETSHIARCARVCYASNNTKNDEQLVYMLKYNKHNSMFRHAPAYYIIPEQNLYINNAAYIDTIAMKIKNKWYVSTNLQCANEYWDILYHDCRISIEEAENNEIFYKNKMLRYTYCVHTGIDITRELNRKSPNNIAEQSTRYVDFCKKIGIKFKKCHWMNHLNLYKRCLVWIMAKTSELFYKLSRSKYGLNLPAQDARWILPLDTMSVAVYSYTVRDWERIINMRVFDWTGKAHPDAKAVVNKIYYNLVDEHGYDIINYKNNHPRLTPA